MNPPYILRIIWLTAALLLSLATNVFPSHGQICEERQRNLLLEMRNGLVYDTHYSTKLSLWQPDMDCCLWPGVTCSSAGLVVGLDLTNESISDGLDDPNSLFDLEHLESLNLGFNKFNLSRIPSRIGRLTNLRYLNLSNEGIIVGNQIPEGISFLKELRALDLSSQYGFLQPLQLQNPNLSMLIQNLTKLTELHLNSVNISASGSEWCQALASHVPNLKVLRMSDCRLAGPIDSSLSKLVSLSVIHLSRNNLSSSFPRYFLNLNLSSLELANCNLNGTFPKEIFQIPTLENLDLTGNRLLHGSLPEFPSNANLRNLLLGWTNFSGRLPDSIGNLQKLSWLVLANCKFTGPLPSSISSLTHLFHVELSRNNLIGSIPPFSSSKNITIINLFQNGLTGEILSTRWYDLKNLKELDLSHNLLTGYIPISLFSLPSLQKLLLANNLFDGSLSEIPKVSSVLLDTLDLSNNNLTGAIPRFLFELQSLDVVSLSYNYFGGYLDFGLFQNLRNLTSLDLSSNKFSSFSPGAASFYQLRRLFLASCNLRAFPNFANASKLIWLDLSNNHIEGKIPKWVWNIGTLNLSHNSLVNIEGTSPLLVPNVDLLDLHSNLFQGDIPIIAPYARYLDYSNNNFFSIPEDIGYNLSEIIFLSISNNIITGSIPVSLCNASKLEILNLSKNRISGIIPRCLIQMGIVLGVMNLRDNNLIGHIPEPFPKNCAFKTLDASQNQLGGHVPVSLANCNMLEVLNLGDNRLDDQFPCFLKNSTSLRVLILRSNKFHGSLSCQVTSQAWSNLQIIDIASNSFSGDLSAKTFMGWRKMKSFENVQESNMNHLRFQIGKTSGLYYLDTVNVTVKGLEIYLVKILTVFTVFDFSNNNFRGNIPNIIGDFRSLFVLNLSHNAFIGSIPSSVGKLEEIESLDLSVNHLNGTIPQEIASLTFLSVFNLSFNQLEGPIPKGSQLQTFEANSYLGNKRLCGFPLNLSCNTAPKEALLPPSKSEFNLNYLSVVLGFLLGLGTIVWPLVFVRRWRIQFFKNVDQIFDKILCGRYETWNRRHVYRNPIRQI